MTLFKTNANGLVKGKTIVVTGCSSGIGARTVTELKNQGAHVIGIDINASRAVDKFIQADLRDPSSIVSAAKLLPAGFDGLCNIAGLPPTRPPADVLKVNFIGLKSLTYALIEKMADGGSITNLASLAGIGWPAAIPQIQALDAIKDMAEVDEFCSRHRIGEEPGRSYSLSKEALIVWTGQNRWTWRNRGIRMNSVSPGPVDTPILQDFVKTLGERVEKDMRVMDRPGTPDDIAPLIAFLQSDGSAWMRGINVPCDGGMSTHVILEAHGLASDQV